MKELKPMKNHHVWVVEIKFMDTDWMTTVAVGLNRDDARLKAREWRLKNSCKARVRQYGYISVK
jgi:hypothetical protein